MELSKRKAYPDSDCGKRESAGCASHCSNTLAIVSRSSASRSDSQSSPDAGDSFRKPLQVFRKMESPSAKVGIRKPQIAAHTAIGINNRSKRKCLENISL
jgi:hypothetical protein